uniref:NR LBD domain-containing protein n=1 Tax=Caenorhabditis tropicalis TaxID=1561998 RepID=A0A1I7UZM4_9PELO
MGDYNSTVKKEGAVVGYFEDNSQPSTSVDDCASQIISFIDVYAYTNSEMTALTLMVNLERNLDNNGDSVDRALFPRHCNAAFDIREAIDFPFPLCERIPTDFACQKFLEDPRANTKVFWCRNVLHFIEWANATQDLGNFTRHEKMLLIAENFLATACLTSFYAFLRIQREAVETAEEGTVPPPCSPEWFAEFSKLAPDAQEWVNRVIVEVLEPMDSLDISMEELVLMKYIIFFNGNEPSKVRSISDVHRIRCYRLKYCQLLQKYIKRHVADPNKRIHRISELLRIIESVRAVSYSLDKWLTMFFTSDVCGMKDVLVYDFHVRAWNEVPVDTSTASTWNTHPPQWTSFGFQPLNLQ